MTYFSLTLIMSKWSYFLRLANKEKPVNRTDSVPLKSELVWRTNSALHSGDYSYLHKLTPPCEGFTAETRPEPQTLLGVWREELSLSR